MHAVSGIWESKREILIKERTLFFFYRFVHMTTYTLGTFATPYTKAAITAQ